MRTVSRGSAQAIIAQIVREHGLPFAVIGTQLAVGALAGMFTTRSQAARGIFALGYSWSILQIALAWIPVLFAVELVRGRHLGKNWRASCQQFWCKYANPAALAGVVLGAIFFSHAAAVHDAWKSSLGVLAPYTWDARLYKVDLALHLGHDPWRVLWHWDSATMVRAIDAMYASWYPMVLIVGCWILWTPMRHLRSRALVAWALQWVFLGTIVAHLFASAGPAFYGHIVPGPSPYRELIVRLAMIDTTTPLNAVFIQNAIWENASSGGGQPWLFMSAMPSIHVSMATMFALVLSQVSRWWGRCAWVYASGILLGSVVLGWHYAVDGYAAMLGMLIIWWGSGKLVRARPTVKDTLGAHATQHLR